MPTATNYHITTLHPKFPAKFYGTCPLMKTSTDFFRLSDLKILPALDAGSFHVK